MPELPEIPEAYRIYLGGLINRWENTYLPDIVKVLKNEIATLTEGLESIIKGELDKLAPEGIEMQKPKINMKDLDFYKDQKYSNLKPDETKLKELNSTDRALIGFICDSIHTVKSYDERHQDVKINDRVGIFHHSATYQDCRKFLFNYLKENNPIEFREVVNSTINDISQRQRYSGFKKAYENLSTMETSQISLNDLEPRAYLHTPTQFRRYNSSIINNLIDKGFLRITPSYAKGVVSVSREFLVE